MHWGAGCLYWFSLCPCIWPRQNWRKTTYKLDSDPKLGHSDLLHKLQSKLRLLLSPLRNTKSKTSVSRFCSHQQGKSQACPQTFGLSPLPIKWNSTWILASQWCPVSNLSAHWWGHWSLFKFRVETCDKNLFNAFCANTVLWQHSVTLCIMESQHLPLKPFREWVI